MDWNLPGSSAHGISQTRMLGNGLPFPSPGDLPLEMEPGSPALQVDSLLTEPSGKLDGHSIISLYRVREWLLPTPNFSFGLHVHQWPAVALLYMFLTQESRLLK